MGSLHEEEEGVEESIMNEFKYFFLWGVLNGWSVGQTHYPTGV